MIPKIPPQYRFLAKFIVILVVAGSAAFGAWYVTSDHYEAIIARHALDDATTVNAELRRVQKSLDDRIETIRLAEEQHATDQITITRLGNQLAGVRIHIPSVSCDPVPGISQTAAHSNGAGGILSERVDAAFAQLQSGVGQLVQRCDQLNIDAIQVNAQH